MVGGAAFPELIKRYVPVYERNLLGDKHMARTAGRTILKYRKHRGSGQAVCTINGRDDPDYDRAINQLKAIDDGCITTLIFNGHGGKSHFGMFMNSNINAPNSPQCKFLNALSTKLSKQCLVDIRVCFVGGNQDFMRNLSKKLGCDV